MTDWAATYAPLIGSTIEALKWRPLTCDTSLVVENYAAPSFWFTGAAQLFFSADRELFLTWNQVGTHMVLEATDESRWGQHVLDSVIAYFDEPWLSVRDSVLVGAHLFTFPDIEGGHIVAVRHDLRLNERDIRLWIGVGWSNGINDTDDLWVGMDIDPPNVADLVEVGRVGA